MKTPLLLLLVLGLATFVLISLHYLGGGAPGETEAVAEAQQWPEKNQSRTTISRVAVLESTGWHDEVVAALVYAIGQQPSTTALTLYLKARRYGIDQLYAAFAPQASIFPARRMRDFLDLPGGSLPAPDVVVLATGERDFANHADIIHHLFTSSPHTRLLCVVHHAAQWEAGRMPEKLLPFILPWVEAGRITFLTLAPHVAEHLSTVAIPTWRGQVSTPARTSLRVRVETWVPVFAVAQAGLAAQRTSVGVEETAFAIQGNFDPGRRNYDGVLSRLRWDGQAAGLTLHLLGSGKGVKVPQGLEGRVVVDSGLAYLPYYAIIARSVALVPSFATDDYYVERASSTVAASLIAGCPLVASRRLLATYTYLDESVVWVQEEDEDEMDVVIHVGHERSAAERRAKNDNVRRRNLELCARSVRQFDRWILEATAARPDIHDSQV
jgi:hypothetical protein